MKDKVKRFFIDKKELLLFIAVVVVVFATVITIASLALSDVPANSDDPIVEPGDDNPDDSNVNEEPEDPNLDDIKKTFSLPLEGEYEVVRTFFDPNLSDEELVSAVISNGSYMIESKGMSYAKADNKTFDVLAIYEGTVTAVEEDELEGTKVTIKHSGDVESIYSSLTDVNVAVGDKVICGQAIGKASTSFFDVEAGVHVHLEVKVNGSYVNPNNIFGKQMDELDTTK